MANKSTGRLKNAAAHIGIGLLRLFSWLPLGFARGCGKLTGRLLFRFNNNSKFLTESNLRAVYPNLEPAALQAMTLSSLQHNAQSVFELGAMWFWQKPKLEKLIRSEHGLEILQAAYAKQNGVIVLAPHIGNWEIVGVYISMNYPSTFMYRPPKLQPVEKPMTESRMRFGANLVPTDLRGVKQIIQALKANHLTGILPDQDAGENGVHANFMGHPARTMTLVNRLLQKTSAQAVFGVAIRHPQGGFELHFLPADREALANVDKVAAATALNQGVEQCIALAPEQYLWAYRRFRGLPEGYPPIYKK